MNFKKFNTKVILQGNDTLEDTTKINLLINLNKIQKILLYNIVKSNNFYFW